jgi:ATP diphosphatase
LILKITVKIAAFRLALQQGVDRLNDVHLEDLLHLMNRLRDPQYGCPWDIKQTYATIVPHTLEEAYEVADAIERGDFDHLQGELGDLLFQVVYYSQLAREEGRFEFAGVVDSITRKLIRRHPHVFPTGDLYAPLDVPRLSEEQVKQRWEEIKAEERAEKSAAPEQLSCSTMCPAALPALSRSAKLQKRAGQVGFDWPDALPVLDKVREELDEVLEAMADNDPQRWPMKSAICCFPWSIWPAISRSIRKPRCVAPTPSSNDVSVLSNRHCATPVVPWKIAPSKSWTPCGVKPNARKRICPAAAEPLPK